MSKTKKCRITNQDFEITDEDLSFYEKIGVPEPTLCPEERQRRRYAWRNERTLYRRDCDLCGKNAVSIYSPDSPYTVYCSTCWWSDNWDPLDYGQDIDFNRPFFDQMKELQQKVPRVSLMNKNCVNSEFTNHTAFSKNCYMSYVAWESEDVLYSNSIVKGKNCVDCYRTEEGSNERLFECTIAFGCYNCQYSTQISDCSTCLYCFDCRGCTDCFMSYNLRNKSYCFMNQQLTKEEYQEKIAALNLGSHTAREKLYKQWIDLIFNEALHRSVTIEQSIASSGNFIYNSKNCRHSFEVNDVEDGAYEYVGLEAKDVMDVYHFGTAGAELMYDCHAVAGGYQTICSHLSYDNSYMEYCDSCHNAEHIFGCNAIRKNSYCILNKKYSKEEYEELRNKLVAHMKEIGEYGEFFPAENSPFAYNETQGQVYMPLSKEEALTRNYNWQDQMPGTYGKETLKPNDIPDNILDVNDSITKEILKCTISERNYNIVPQELQFYKQNNIPIPRLHPDERYLRRKKLRPARKLYDGTCSMTGAALKTAWPPESRPKNTVSEKAYKREVL